MAIIALCIGFDVILGLTNRQYTVMAITAVAANLLVIHKGGDRKPKHGVAGLTYITGAEVIECLGGNRRIYAVVTIDAIGRQTDVDVRSRVTATHTGLH